MEWDYMNIALTLAESVQGQTSPNPPVGSVIVQDGSIVGMGSHLKAGEAHAEIHALKMAGDKAKGATLYVTLEPCSHVGKTPPCVDAVIESGIKRVVIATMDRNPKVAGKGVEKLRQANVSVEVGIGKEQAESLYASFFHFTSTRTPFVTLKSATSLDGKTATVTGESKWITGESARKDVHQYRNNHDAILVGVDTIIADNPQLTTRLPNGGRNPTRIILDTHLRTPRESNVITDGEAETWIFTGENVSPQTVEVFRNYPNVKIVQLNQEKIKVGGVLNYLGEQDIMTLFVEGGAGVNGSFLQENAVNQVISYVAPLLIGGKDAPTSIAGVGMESLNNALRLHVKSVEKIGEDIKIVSVPRKEG